MTPLRGQGRRINNLDATLGVPASCGKTKLSLVNQSDLGGKALKVERLSGDSFGDFVLQGADEPAAGLAGAGALAGPPVSYHITGRIGGMTVDLIAEPLPGTPGAMSAVKVPVKTDPARLARIRAAKMPAITRPGGCSTSSVT